MQTTIWLPPMLSMLGSLIVVVFAAWLNTKAFMSQIEALRSEMTALRVELRGEMATLRAEMRAEMSTLRAEVKQGIAELELRLTVQISNLSQRVEKLEEQRGLVRP